MVQSLFALPASFLLGEKLLFNAGIFYTGVCPPFLSPSLRGLGPSKAFFPNLGFLKTGIFRGPFSLGKNFLGLKILFYPLLVFSWGPANFGGHFSPFFRSNLWCSPPKFCCAFGAFNTPKIITLGLNKYPCGCYISRGFFGGPLLKTAVFICVSLKKFHNLYKFFAGGRSPNIRKFYLFWGKCSLQDIF